MNAIFALQQVAGQIVQENLYSTTWVWNGQTFPCTHGDIQVNPPLLLGGFSPSTEVWVTVRTSLFGYPGLRPVKGDNCQLTATDGTQYSLRIQTSQSAVGSGIIKFFCQDVNQGA